MKKTVLQLTVITLVLLMYQNIFSQSIVNKEWELGFGLPDTIDIGATVIDNSENIYTTGNTIVQGQKANILTTRYDKDGNLIWEKTFNYQGASKDYGTCITIDNNGYIYVAGASFVNAAHLTDYTILKYDTSGTLIWSTNYNEANFKIDVPTAITLDNSGNIYVTGVSAGNTTNEDYLTIKLDNNGNVLWHSKYNYANLADRALGIVIDNQNNVIVTGYSYSSSNNSDITTIKYDGTNGNELTVIRDVQTGLGFDEPSQIKKDNNGDIIIAGYIANQTQGYNIKTVKYDNTLNTIWEQTYDGNGLNDKSKSMEMDLQGNIIVTGYTTNQNNTKDIVTIKYDNAGTQLWTKTRPTVDQLGNCEAQKIKTDIMGNTYLLCEKIENGIRDILTIKYNDIGEKKWEKTYTATNNEVINDLKVSQDGKVYLTTKEDANYKTVKYATYDMPMEAVYDTSGNPIFAKNEIIIRFDSSMVKRNSVDKVGLQYGNAPTFLKDTIIELMKTVLPPSYVDQATFIKVFTKLTTADSLSITRLGDTIPISPFWTTFRMTISKDGLEKEFADSLNTLYPAITYSHINAIGQLDDIPDDELVTTEQESLIQTSPYINAHIGMDDAWDNETGQAFVKVGVFDHLIYWKHEDFGDGTFNGSKIKDGWDYGTQQHISGVTTPTHSHGTSCAGIIGALRNNGKGIAGIAGGDIYNDNNPGVSLYSFGIISDYWIPISYASNAIVEGAISSGYGLHVQSHSWGIEMDVTYQGHTINQGDIKLLTDATNECFKNHCIFVASRGNDGDTDIKYPACSKDEHVINVGASGTDGIYHNGTHGDIWWSSSYGGNVDVIAPGVTEIVAAPIYTGAPPNWQNCDVNLSGYSCFNGTSSAAPHVAGVAALMCSRHNTQNGYPNNLAPEDVEHLIQKYATDVGTYGYDEQNGHGRLDAGYTMPHVNGHYKILHDNSPTSFSYTSSSNMWMCLIENSYGLAAGYYIAKRNVITHIYQFSFNSDVYILDYWGRLGSTIGVTDLSNQVNSDAYAYYDWNVSGDAHSATMTVTTFCWKVINSASGQYINKWYPASPQDLKTAISLQLFDYNWDNIEEIGDENTFKIYPNPADNIVNIEYELTKPQKLDVEIYNNLGQLVLLKTYNKTIKGTHNIDISNYNKGLYFVRFISEENIKTEKLIIN